MLQYFFIPCGWTLRGTVGLFCVHTLLSLIGIVLTVGVVVVAEVFGTVVGGTWFEVCNILYNENIHTCIIVYKHFFKDYIHI